MINEEKQDSGSEYHPHPNPQAGSLRSASGHAASLPSQDASVALYLIYCLIICPETELQISLGCQFPQTSLVNTQMV